jgi:hypothetical protein
MGTFAAVAIEFHILLISCSQRLQTNLAAPKLVIFDFTEIDSEFNSHRKYLQKLIMLNFKLMKIIAGS